MKKIGNAVIPVFIFLLLMCFSKKSYPDNSSKALEQKIALESYKGKWFINMSTFPMWLKGEKKYPSFNYTVEKHDSVLKLLGDVQYYKKEKLKHIKGTDKPVNDFNTAFQWRGKGFLKLVKSNWEIVAWNKEDNWAIMHFEKTAFTPEGYDLFSRQKKLDSRMIADVRKKLVELGLEEKLTVVEQE